MMLYLRVVPGFGIAVEMARRPEIRSRAIVLGGLPHQRGMVREASFLAQRSGVRAGMALSQAHQQCPDAIFLAPDLPHYEAVWGEVCALLFRFTPLVEPLEMGQAICDLSGCERHWEDLAEAARSLAAGIRRFGIAPWLGIASNRITAELASTVVGEDGITIVDRGRERDFLADLPLSVLPGSDPRLALAFQVLGLRTLGQLAALPAAAVRQRFGAAGERLHAWARGADSRRVVPPAPKPVVAAHHTCDEGTVEEAAELVRRLAEECAGELAQRRLAGRLITLKLWWFPVGVEESTHLISATPQKTLKLRDKPNLPSSSPDIAETAMRCSLPIPYRIHSMLPQPGNKSQVASRKSQDGSQEVAEVAEVADGSQVASHKSQSSKLKTQNSKSITNSEQRTANSEHFDAVSTVVRTAIDSAGPLEERARRLLLQRWPRSPVRPLQALSLEVSEFEQPVQLAFSEIDRIDQSGRLRGMDAIRRQTLLRQEEVLATRYGDPTFRHVTDVDPSSILTERRFRWSAGLFIEASPGGDRAVPTRRRR